MSDRALGLRTKLVGLLLAFGVIPLVVAITVGFAVSRDLITRQVLGALHVLTQAQAVHLATELDRERLLLRTIAGQLPPDLTGGRVSSDELAQRLVQGLPEGGVFDGLRIVGGAAVLASVALRNTEPHWPPDVPAADWRSTQVVVHRDGGTVLAYLIAVPLATASPDDLWLEGHVRAEDFGRVFSIPEHLMDGAESVVVEVGGRPLFAGHSHGMGDVLQLVSPGWLEATDSGATATADALLAVAPVAGADWRLVSALPADVAFASLSRLRNTALVGSGALVLLILVTGLAAAGSVTTPLRRLAHAVARFGREGRHEPVDVRSRDEVGAVVRTFNAMAVGLQRSREEVEALHARDLERAQQLATVGELASGVAHEIRNPLTGVRGALDLALRRLPAEGDSRALLEEAQLQLARIEGTTTQLLRYARPPDLHQIETDTAALVDRAVTIVTPQAARDGVAIEVEGEATVPVRVDPELMVQVLVNLLLNAVEAAPEGGRVSIRQAARDGVAEIAVRDTGSGVPDAAKREIFRPFYTTKHQGTGLGLSISRQIVERHGGTLQCADAAGGGAVFTVALPGGESRGTP